MIAATTNRDRGMLALEIVHTMTRRSRSRERVFAGFGLGLLVPGRPGGSRRLPHLPVKAPVPTPSRTAMNAYDWNGWYVGAHVGVIRGSSNWSATQPGAGGRV